MMNLLQIVQRACGLIGLDKPASVVGNSDVIATAMLDLIQEETDELSRITDWSALTVQNAQITLLAGQETYDLPGDFDRLVQGTSWDTTNRWVTFGPDSPQTAQWRRQSVNAGIGPRRALRQVGSFLTVWPLPGADGDILSFDYVSNYTAVNFNAVTQQGFLADTDMPILPDRLYPLGLRWRWRKANGFEFQTDFAIYSDQVRLAQSRDKGGGRVLRMTPDWDYEDANADGVIAGAPTVVLGTDGGSGIAID